MWYLVNTMNSVEIGHVGRVLSAHRSQGAAECADVRHQRAVRRANGSASYLPTIVVQARKVGQYARDCWCDDCDMGYRVD